MPANEITPIQMIAYEAVYSLDCLAFGIPMKLTEDRCENLSLIEFPGLGVEKARLSTIDSIAAKFLRPAISDWLNVITVWHQGEGIRFRVPPSPPVGSIECHSVVHNRRGCAVALFRDPKNRDNLLMRIEYEFFTTEASSRGNGIQDLLEYSLAEAS